MKDKSKSALAGLILLAVLLGVGYYIGQMPKGILQVGHCGNVSENSDVCFCDSNEERVIVNNSYECKLIMEG